jgi:hypothetical protein
LSPQLRQIVLINYGVGLAVGALICFLVICTAFGWLMMLGVFPIVSSALMSWFMRWQARS